MSDRNQAFLPEEEDTTGFADVALSGYALLRLSPRRLAAIARHLSAPVLRLHKLRNTRTQMWRDALCRRDCHEC